MAAMFRTLLVVAASTLILAASVESAAAWACRAKSRVADGWGYSPILAQAREEAKLQCQLHTARKMSCRIVSCRR